VWDTNEPELKTGRKPETPKPGQSPVFLMGFFLAAFRAPFLPLVAFFLVLALLVAGAGFSATGAPLSATAAACIATVVSVVFIGFLFCAACCRTT
jgi:hypothetical protein